MRWFALGLAVAVSIASLVSDRLAVHVTPTALFEGQAVRVTCHVPLHAENRRLQVALEGELYT